MVYIKGGSEKGDLIRHQQHGRQHNRNDLRRRKDRLRAKTMTSVDAAFRAATLALSGIEFLKRTE